eukprot:CAMPEP_0185907516 /NCGR_PEP_ID=MMETSP0196C-20130402/7263_1 /TAXON_ID=2932 /ORGANISM="Alexandrium fundyense, Strain CCMP1719" /LENGTH=42 /DNA_ID= /DNA_START= /DNA_END= /DNA_ORIENTATION=
MPTSRVDSTKLMSDKRGGSSREEPLGEPHWGNTLWHHMGHHM